MNKISVTFEKMITGNANMIFSEKLSIPIKWAVIHPFQLGEAITGNLNFTEKYKEIYKGRVFVIKDENNDVVGSGIVTE